MLGMADVAATLETTLDEEKEADLKLTGIAEGWINKAAMTPGPEPTQPVNTMSTRKTTNKPSGKAPTKMTGKLPSKMPAKSPAKKTTRR